MVSIGKASGENEIALGTQAWNIADGYTKIKILRLLIELDLHETIAKFGRKDMEEYIPYSMIAERKVEAIHRMLFSLRQLIGNCHFSIEKGEDERIIMGLLNRLSNIEKVIEKVSDFHKNDVTKEDELVINIEHFEKVLEILHNIKDELNFPINRSGLIFRKSEDIDLDKIMNDIVEGG